MSYFMLHPGGSVGHREAYTQLGRPNPGRGLLIIHVNPGSGKGSVVRAYKVRHVNANEGRGPAAPVLKCSTLPVGCLVLFCKHLR